jgi:hypothetical protein
MPAVTASAADDLSPSHDGGPATLLARPVTGGPLDLGHAAFMMAERLVEPDAWIGHIPFAFWLIDAHRPGTVVELGTHSGNSYCAFCQAVVRLQLPTSCTAVDSWIGDPQAGFYGEDVYRELSEYHDRRYGSFSRLLRTTFDEAMSQFADGSIDLLHIDGYHTYDAVRHDFETWRNKLSDRAIVLFHDVNERGPEFGAWRIWEELTRTCPSFTFLHSHGLGVLAVGARQSPAVSALLAAGEDEAATQSVRAVFSQLGRAVNAERLLAREVAQHQELASGVASLAADRDRHAKESRRLAAHASAVEAQRDQNEAAVSRLRDECDRLENAVRNAGKQLGASRNRLAFLQTRSATMAEQLRARTAELARERRRRRKMKRSLSWRISKPLRMLGSLASRMVKKPRTQQKAAPAVPPPALREPLPPLLPPYFHGALKYAEPEPFREIDAASRARLCCLVHLYYIDLWDEIGGLLRNLSGLDHQIMVNFVESTVTEQVLARAAAEFPDATVLVSPNEGRDVGGILRLAARADLDRFDAVMMLHGKRSATLPPEWGTTWRQVLMQPLIGSATIARLNAARMAADRGCGMIASASCSSTFMGDNRPTVDMLAEKMGIPPEHRTAPFVAGSMFLARPELVREMVDCAQDLRFASADTAGAASVIDGQLEHAVERIYGALTAARGHRIVWRDTRVSEVDLGLG